MKKFLLPLVVLAAFAPVYAGTGTAEDPYTCAEVIAMNPTSTTEAVQSDVWVRGYIVGCYYDYDAHFTATGAQATNVLISDDAAASDKAQTVCVQLVSKSDTRAAVNLLDNPANLGLEVNLCGDVMKYNTLPGIKNTSAYKFTGNGESVEPEPVPSALYEALTDGQSDFTIENVTIPSELTSVWSWNSSYKYMLASGFKSAAYAADSWLISPELDLTKATKVAANFDHVVNKFASVESAKAAVSFAVRVDGGAWQTLEIPEWSTNSNWTFVNSGDIDLTAYAGKTVQLGFHYTSTAEDAGSWELKNLKLTGEGEVSVVAPEVAPVEVANIAAFLAGKDADAVYKFTNSVNVTYQNGSRLYVEDATGSLLIFGTTGQTYVTGDVIPAGFSGKYAEFGQAPQLGTPADFAASTSKVTVTPEEFPIEELGADMVSKYIKIVNVTIEAGDKDKYYTATDETGSVTLYDQFGVTPAVGENLTVVGIYTTYNGAPQLQPITVTDESGVVVERVATPVFTPGEGAVVEGTLVTIETATEGAAIYFTLDGTEPTDASELYSEPIAINEAVTIKAIALKDGFEASAVAVAAYTLRQAGNYRGEFDSFNNGKTSTSYITSTNATGWTAENCAVLSGNADGKDSNPSFAFIDSDPSTLAVCLNGKTSAVGKVTSPVLTGGIGTLTFSYGLPFADTKIGFTVNVTDAEGAVLASEKVANDAGEKFKAYEFSLPVNKDGDFKVEIVNDSPSASSSNKDRVAIWHLTWTDTVTGAVSVAASEAEAPVEYFNLQGIRVANPEGGVFIRRQGNKVEKVVIR